jgi:16S rRNA (cytosine1402-N4)-methyltransferase
MHTPVLLHEVIDALNIVPNGRYIDATFGAGGHSREILSRKARVLAIDWDEENIAEKIKSDEWGNQDDRFRLVWGNFADIESIAKKYDFVPADGILFDLGLSMDQLGFGERGMSFKKTDEPLDMRISKKSGNKKAAEIINSSNADELYEIFSRNAQEIDSRPIAETIFRACRVRRIDTVGDLLMVLDAVEMPMRSKREHVYRKIFQALRMTVNDELHNIQKALAGAREILSDSGLIAIITFHETEDRLVKQEAKRLSLYQVYKKPIMTHTNKMFEQSAKARIYRKTL